jgi:cbb3-type cytochrome oxidase subunit 3
MHFRKKNLSKSNSKSTILTFIFIILLILILFTLFRTNYFKRENVAESENSTLIRFKVFPWNKYYGTLSNFLIENSAKVPPLPEELKDKELPEVVDNEPVNNKGENKPSYSAYFVASLTSSPGSLGIYGETKGLEVYLNGNKLSKNTSGIFSGGAGGSFSVLFKGSEFERKVTVNSPSFANNFVLERLSLVVDPLNLVATISGKVNLNLPGEIKGTLFNASNGTANSTVLKNGAFTASVPLNFGVNNLTASGSWLTIKLDLPVIVVNIS